MNEQDADKIARMRRAYDAFNRGDFDAALEVGGLHPEFEYVPPGGLAPVRGAESFRAWMEPDAFDSQVAEPLDFRIAGNRVLVLQRTRSRGAASGIEMEADSWGVWTLDEAGLVTRFETFFADQEAEALRAAGLEE
jgi:ketosteroid isomerase-like protein